MLPSLGSQRGSSRSRGWTSLRTWQRRCSWRTSSRWSRFPASPPVPSLVSGHPLAKLSLERNNDDTFRGLGDCVPDRRARGHQPGAYGGQHRLSREEVHDSGGKREKQHPGRQLPRTYVRMYVRYPCRPTPSNKALITSTASKVSHCPRTSSSTTLLLGSWNSGQQFW